VKVEERRRDEHDPEKARAEDEGLRDQEESHRQKLHRGQGRRDGGVHPAGRAAVMRAKEEEEGGLADDQREREMEPGDGPG
jgi:hypothetical protein